MIKRTFDVTVAALGLIALIPLLALIALAVRWDSPGPVFFRQVRVGRHGVPFRIHKFRTMVVDAPCQGPAVTAAGDPRITRTGAWLRRSKLDELPQLLDVLAGHMSLVGPRPEVPQYVALYPPALRDEALAVRPGITDPVSLEFLDESDRLARSADPEREYVEVILPEKLKASVAYARRATLGSDIRVLFRTTFRLLAKKDKQRSP
jgi:lipopolysaccharide/colanic/teichoic acid biosynthesis glycosyltransferase